MANPQNCRVNPNKSFLSSAEWILSPLVTHLGWGPEGPGDENRSCHPLFLVSVIPKLSLKEKIKSQEPVWQPTFLGSSALGADDDPEGGNIRRLPVIVSLATRVLRVIARCGTKPCHSWPDILWQMSDEELGRWYSPWSYILTRYQVLKSACRQKPYIINGSFEKLVNYHKFYLSLLLHSFYGNMFVEMYNI